MDKSDVQKLSPVYQTKLWPSVEWAFCE